MTTELSLKFDTIGDGYTREQIEDFSALLATMLANTDQINIPAVFTTAATGSGEQEKIQSWELKNIFAATGTEELHDVVSRYVTQAQAQKLDKIDSVAPEQPGEEHKKILKYTLSLH